MSSQSPNQEGKLTTAHRLTMWRLAVAGGTAWSKAIHPKLTPAVRNKLVDSGWVVVHRKRDPKSKRPSLKLELTDAGWAWTAANMKMERLEGCAGAGDVLQHMLEVLSERFSDAGMTPEDVFRRDPEASGEEESAVATEEDEPPEVEVEVEAAQQHPEPPGKHPDEKAGEPPGQNARGREPRMPAPIVDAAIKRAYLDATKGHIEVAVEVGEVRRRVYLSPHEFNAALARMHREGKLEIDESAGEGDAALVVFREDAEDLFFESQRLAG